MAENAGGGKAVKYGVTGRYVTGLEVVTPTGEIVEMGGKLVKDVTGYNLIPLMVGSEGTLGVFTKITLKLMPLPRSSVDLLVLFRTTEGAIAAVPQIMTGGGVIPTAMEFMDQTSVQAACEYLNETIPYQQAGAMLLITVDGSDAGAGGARIRGHRRAVPGRRGDRGLRGGQLHHLRAHLEGPAEHRRGLQGRQPPPEPGGHRRAHRAHPDMVAGLMELSRKYDVAIPCYGHAGDGNLHATPVMNPAWPLDRWHATLPDILTDLYKLTASLGGTISGEHGIGHKRKSYLPLVCSEAHIEVMRAIKRALDPNNILNPGKIFDV